jgi:hypothetical protein
MDMSKIDMTKVRVLMPNFQRFISTDGTKWMDERKEKDEFFERYFSEQQIDNLEEGTLRELVHLLWSYAGWTNKDYVLENMLQSGLPIIRSAFKQLLFSNEPISKRYDLVKNNVRAMGVASISEILAHHNHNEYPIFNRRSKQGLLRLGMDMSRSVN